MTLKKQKSAVRKKYWFNPKSHSEWKKSQTATTRRRKLLASTDKRKSIHDRYVSAARKIQALANVTKDLSTKRKAKSDAMYFFRKAKPKK